jgi:hypothetical protein
MDMNYTWIPGAVGLEQLSKFNKLGRTQFERTIQGALLPMHGPAGQGPISVVPGTVYNGQGEILNNPAAKGGNFDSTA